VRAADVVLADGTVARADAADPDLLWAVRGAGAGVGVVTAFEIEATRLRDVGVARLVAPADLPRWAACLRSAPRDLSTVVTLAGRTMHITAVFTGREPPLKGLGRIERVPYPALVSHRHPNVGQQPVNVTNGLLSTMDDGAAEAVTGLARSGRVLVQLRSLGGAVNDIAAEATAYPHRHQQTLVVASTFPPDGRAELDAAWRGLAGRADGAYLNFESRRDRAAFDRAYPGRTGERVAGLWRRYDPDGVFHGVAGGTPA
jgi:hypothetical protein